MSALGWGQARGRVGTPRGPGERWRLLPASLPLPPRLWSALTEHLHAQGAAVGAGAGMHKDEAGPQGAPGRPHKGQIG